MRIEYLNKELRDTVSVLRCLRLYGSFPFFDLYVVNQYDFNFKLRDRKPEEEYSSFESLRSATNLSETKLRVILSKLTEEKYIDKSKDNSYKINDKGIYYLEYNIFKQDQLKYSTNNPIKRIENISKILFPLIALFTLGLSIRNCSRIESSDNKKLSTTTLNLTQANDETSQKTNTLFAVDRFIPTSILPTIINYKSIN